MILINFLYLTFVILNRDWWNCIYKDILVPFIVWEQFSSLAPFLFENNSQVLVPFQIFGVLASNMPQNDKYLF